MVIIRDVWINANIKGTIRNKKNGDTYDFAKTINEILSDDHVFIQSNSTTNNNKYLWENYGDKGKGVCLRLSTEQFIKYINENLQDFILLPNYLKCCLISYDYDWANKFMGIIFSAIQKTNNEMGKIGYFFLFFFIDYWKNFIKTKEPYSSEKEIRFVVSDNYSLFLFFCSKFTEWGIINTKYPEEVSECFFQEYKKRKSDFYTKLKLEVSDNNKFVTVPFLNILDSITIGPKSETSKNDISIKSNRQIKKSRIKKIFITTWSII